jgi:MoxR-like ATPase
MSTLMMQEGYTGEKLLEKKEFTYQDRKIVLDPYIPDDGLKEAVKMAQALKHPLLLQGEPGCGKSRLAEAVAYELFKEDFPGHYFEWRVKSGSKAQEGLYTINNLQRLRDATIKEGQNPDLDIKLTRGDTQGKYIELGPLGKVFVKTSSTAVAPPVLLIDEIDKADIDFPNDLLQELDRMEFEIPEAVDENGEVVQIRAQQENRPLIIITSNEEKPLPAAFLRRCIFYYIEFPGKEALQRIVMARWPGTDNEFISNATTLFTDLHDTVKKAAAGIKNISTSELLDWITLIKYNYPHADGGLNLGNIPYEQALAKDRETLQVFLNFKEKANKSPQPATT